MFKKTEPEDFELGFPAMRYRPSTELCGYEYKIVNSSQQEKELGSGWYSSPGHFGVETCPGLIPDPKIAAAKIAFEKGIVTPFDDKQPELEISKPKQEQVKSLKNRLNGKV